MKKDESKVIINELHSLQEYADEWKKKYYTAFNKIEGKWVYFSNNSSPSNHGKVIKDNFLPSTVLTIRCKNGCRRYIKPKDIVAIFDTKKECFDYKPEVDE